jgi:hypothetical protein
MVFGMIGALLSLVVHLYREERPQGPATHGPRLATMKCAGGVCTACVGVVAVTAAPVAVYDSVPAVLLLALAFGCAQDEVTNSLDKRAGSLLPSEKDSASSGTNRAVENKGGRAEAAV